MSDPIEDFESACAQAGFAPTAVLREAGLNQSTWFRWKAGTVSPTLRSFEAARLALVRMVDRHVPAPVVDDGKTMAPALAHGADNPDRNVSRTGEAA
jgi:hypothetical protein